jgi:hypothetical protein
MPRWSAVHSEIIKRTRTSNRYARNLRAPGRWRRDPARDKGGLLDLHIHGRVSGSSKTKGDLSMRMCIRFAWSMGVALLMEAVSFGQHYNQTNLVSSVQGLAPVTDSDQDS